MRKSGSYVPHEVVEQIFKDIPIPIAVAWREHVGLTVAEAAERAGLSPSEYSALERSDPRPAASREIIAAALGINVEQLPDLS